MTSDDSLCGNRVNGRDTKSLDRVSPSYPKSAFLICLGAKLPSIRDGVLRTDSFENWAVFGRESTRQITAQRVYAMRSADLVPQTFEGKRSLDIAIYQQVGRHFSADHYLRMFSP
jgi:hypothetical protein